MDYIESLAKQASQITMYDVKSYYNQAKNMVLNLTEMEAKVRDATNDEPWGASSTLMQEIADGTHNFAQFNEIMPTIYSRFMEKEAREWRQIYKALTLLEFLVKNGSERVVDDARAHISTIKMLRSFHYIDEKGKDQGINVRNRSSEIALLLSDVDKIRQERRKAKANKSKYQGQGNDGGMSFITSGGSRYGGFGSETVGSGGGGGGGGSSRYGGSSGYENDHYRPSRSAGHDRSAPAEYDEYEGADDFDDDQPPRRAPSASSSRRPNPPQKSEPRQKDVPKATEAPAPKAKEVNLFDFDDDEPAPASAPAPAAAAPAASSNILGGDDDFDDFQSGPSTSPPPAFAAAAPKGQNGANTNLFDLLNSSTPSVPAAPIQTHAKAPSFSQPSYQPQQSFNLAQPVQPAMTSRPSYTSAASQSTVPAVSPKPTGASSSSGGGLGGFDDLWNTSLSSAGVKVAQKQTGGKTMGDLDREKAMGSLWGKTQQQQQAGGFAGASTGAASNPSGGSGFDDLLM